MELNNKDIRNVSDLRKQLNVFSIIAEQLADDCSTVQSLKIEGISDELKSELNRAQVKLYQASTLLAQSD